MQKFIFYIISGWVGFSLLYAHASGLDSSAALLKVIQQSSQFTPAGYCLNSSQQGDLIPIPAGEFQIIGQALETSVEIDPQWIRQQFKLKSRSSPSEIKGLDLLSRSNQKAIEHRISFSSLEKPTVFAGGEVKNYAIPSEVASSQFLSSLFKRVIASTESWNQTQLNRWDLFHAHMVYHSSLRDLFIVFHAKEYPYGNPSMCQSCSIFRLFQFLDELPPSFVQSIPPHPSYSRRNYIWSFRRNILCGVDTTQMPFSVLALDWGDSSTLDENKVSDLGSQGKIMNINNFEAEGVPLFYDFFSPHA